MSTLRTRYPDSSLTPLMRFTAVSTATNEPVRTEPYQAGAAPPEGVQWAYLPRIKCNDCPGKLYTAMPEKTVENFETHLKNRKHVERVERRKRGEA